MFPDEDEEGPGKEVWDEYGVVINHEPYKAAAAALSIIPSSGILPGIAKTGIKREKGVKMEVDGVKVGFTWAT
jgi:hypothetical protein